MGSTGKMPKFTLPEAHKHCKTQKELALHMGMAIGTLVGWERQGLIRKKKNGWHSRDVLNILEQKLADADEAEEDQDEVSMSDGTREWLEEKRKWQAKIAELAYEKKKGELLDREEVLGETSSMLREFRHRLSRLPKELKLPLRGLDPDAIEERLAEELSKALNELADWVEKYHKQGEKSDE